MSVTTASKTQPSMLTDYSIAVLSCCLESLLEQATKFQVCRTSNAAQHLDVLNRKLERRSFESNVPRRVSEDESEIDVYQMSVTVQQDVAVVAILDLQEVCYDRVS